MPDIVKQGKIYSKNIYFAFSKNAHKASIQSCSILWLPTKPVPDMNSEVLKVYVIIVSLRYYSAWNNKKTHKGY